MKLQFVKFSGAGNDFILIDNHDGRLSLDAAALARALCSRRLAVGADGVIVLDPPTQPGADFAFTYHNADGSVAGMCGNGGRCAARLALDLGLGDGTKVRFDAPSGRYEAEPTADGGIRLSMIAPRGYVPARSVDASGGTWSVASLDTGTPHAVVFLADEAELRGIELDRVGRALRHHPALGPGGTNVNFAAPAAGGWALRTFERGVEGETLACGTGTVAVAVVAFLSGRTERTQQALRVASGETLRVGFAVGSAGGDGAAGIGQVTLSGEARRVYTGEVEWTG